MSDDIGEEIKLRKSKQEEVLREASERFRYTLDREATTRKLFVEDVRFAHGDSDNGWQWPVELKKDRDQDMRPCLTINKIRQHNLNIINEIKQNRPRVKFIPTSTSASFDCAKVLNALVRRIEYRSHADAVYANAVQFCVHGGFGYWRLGTNYLDDMSFDQEIYIQPIKDPLTVMIDPDTLEEDKSDMKYAFIWEDVDDDEFAARFPEWKDLMGADAPLDIVDESWQNKDTTRVSEYWRITQTKDTLFAFEGEDGQPVLTLKSILGEAETTKRLAKNPQVRSREVLRNTVERHTIVGKQIVKSEKWPGKYIPIVPVIAEEVTVDGVIDRKSHTRALKDPQRMYNYWSSSAVEFGALQTKTPWVAPAEAIEGFETIWTQANTQNFAYLPYRAFDEDGNAIPPPRRTEPPVPAPVAITGMEVASREMEMTSGQYGQMAAEPGNERTGKALQERDRQGDRATFHYKDGLARALQYTGKIILDLLPAIYDTQRMMTLVDEENQNFSLRIDPDARQEYLQKASGETVERILSPILLDGYDVQASAGPSFQTLRQEAFDAISVILTQSPQLISLVGDLMFRAADFPLADEIATRLRRMVPPEALGQGPTPKEQQMQMEIQRLQGLLQSAVIENIDAKLRLRGKDEKRETDIYKAGTERIKAIMPFIDPTTGQLIVSDTMQEVIGADLLGISLAHDQMRQGQLGQGGMVQPEDANAQLQQAGVTPQPSPHGIVHTGVLPGAPPQPPQGGQPPMPQNDGQ